MNERAKRIAALILAVVLTASLLAGCSSSESTAAEDEVVTDVETETGNETATETETETEGEEDPVAWLEEQMENIQKSLLAGDYEAVITLLETMQGDLSDNAQYNALLYVAYMGSGTEENVKKAEEILEKEKENEEFHKKVADVTTGMKTHGTEEVKAQAETIEQVYGEGKEELLRKDPKTYQAVTGLGQNLKPEGPTTPTDYAILYANAMLDGDKETAKAIIEEAEANGVAKKDLKNAVIKYEEEYDVVIVWLGEEGKGQEIIVTYGSDGSKIKLETAVQNPDGTQTVTIKDREGRTYAVANYSKYGAPTTNVIYNYENVKTDENTVVMWQLAEIEEYDYRNRTITWRSVAPDGTEEVTRKLTLNRDGTAKSYVRYENGQEVSYSSEVCGAIKAEFDDRDLASLTWPILEEGTNKIVGKTVDQYNYTFVAPIVTDRQKYDENGNLYYDAEYTYVNNKPYVEMSGATATDTMSGITNRYDPANKMYYETWHVDGSYFEYTLDETAKYQMTGEGYLADGTLAVRYFGYYTGAKLTSEVEVEYDENGRVANEKIYKVDPQTNKMSLKNEVEYSYNADGKIDSVTELQWEGDDYTQAIKTNYAYDAAGNTTSIYEYTYGTGAMLTGVKMTSYVYDGAGRQNFEIIGVYDKDFNLMDQTIRQDFYFADGRKQGTIIKALNEYGISVQVGQEQYSYNEDGSVSKMEYWAIDAAGNGTKSQGTYYTYNEDGSKKVEVKDLIAGTSTVTESTYNENGALLTESTYETDAEDNKGAVTVTNNNYDDDGNKTGYTVTVTETDGRRETKYYTAEGYEYQVAVYEGNGKLIMLMNTAIKEDSQSEAAENETAESGTPEGGVPESGVPEGGAPEDAATEGEVTEDAATEGEVTEGEATEDAATEGEVTEDAATEGEVTEDAATEGEAAEGEATEDAATEDAATEGETDAPSEDTTDGAEAAPQSDAAAESAEAPKASEAAPQSDSSEADAE